MESSKSPTGLGKGLAGILGDALDQTRAPEVSSLLGSKAVRRAPEVRKLVSELGLRFIAESFASDGAIIVRREPEADLATVTAQLPDAWHGLDAFGLELSGQLWVMLGEGEDGFQQSRIAERWVLFSKQTDSEGSATAAAVVRNRAFSDDDQATIAQLLHSISAAASGDGFDLVVANYLEAETETETAADSSPSLDCDETTTVMLNLQIAQVERTSVATGPSEATAAAVAACSLCLEPLAVRFAGETIVSGALVSLVVLRTGDRADGGAPIFGLAVGGVTSALGAAEAVFRAARVVRADPFCDLAA